MTTLPSQIVSAWMKEEDDVIATSGKPSWVSLVKALKKTVEEREEVEARSIIERIEEDHSGIIFLRRIIFCNTY